MVMDSQVKNLSPQIFDAIKKSNNILLHCHPSPDSDSIGGSLAFMHALSALGKNVTVIKGDSEIPDFFSCFPGVEKIVKKNYFEIDPTKFDLFIITDSSAPDQISRVNKVVFPANLVTVVIDHHVSNQSFGSINLVDSSYPANCQLIYDLFVNWGIDISKEIAICLMLGIYGDSKFKYPLTTSKTFQAASKLASIAPDFPKYIFKLENNNPKERIYYEGLALNSIENYFSSKVAISIVSFEKLLEKNIKSKDIQNTEISNTLKSVTGWDIGISFVEKEKDTIVLSFRTRDPEKYDVSKIALELKGGGHKAAAGASLNMPFVDAKKLLIEKLKQVYPDLGEP